MIGHSAGLNLFSYSCYTSSTIELDPGNEVNIDKSQCIQIWVCVECPSEGCVDNPWPAYRTCFGIYVVNCMLNCFTFPYFRIL
jgi:hypothetical protein